MHSDLWVNVRQSFCLTVIFNQHCGFCFLFQTPLSEAGSLSEGATAFDVIAAGGPLSIDTGGDLGELHLPEGLCVVPVPCFCFNF